jgi:hypothetical protein
MGSQIGDDRDAEGGGFGVLGTATPRTANLGGGSQAVDSYGVWGILGTADAVANIPERIASLGTFGPLQRVAILGRNALPDQGFAIYGESRANDSAVTDAFGFIAGRSPFAGELTGVFGQAPQRGMIGIAGSPNGIGVYGGSVDGAGTGVFGDAGDHQAGVIGRSNGSKGVGVQGENTGGGLAGLFQGNVRVDGGTLTVQGQDLLARVEQLAQEVSQLAQQVSQLPVQTNRGVPVARPTRPNLIVSPSGTTVTINGQGFKSGALITLHLTHTVPSSNEEDRTGRFPIEFILESGDHVTVVGTDGTPDPFDSTGFLWSFQRTFDV